jgi:hypothetical protein
LKALLNCDSFIIDVGLERRREFWKRQKQTTSRTNGLRSDPPSHIQGVDDTKDLIYMYDSRRSRPTSIIKLSQFNNAFNLEQIILEMEIYP